MDRRWTEASLLVAAELPLAEAGCRQHAGMGTLSCAAGCAGRVWVEGGDGSCLPRKRAACAQFPRAPASTQIPASWVTGVLNIYCHASSLDAVFEVYKNHIPCILTDIGCIHCFSVFPNLIIQNSALILFRR